MFISIFIYIAINNIWLFNLESSSRSIKSKDRRKKILLDFQLFNCSIVHDSLGILYFHINKLLLSKLLGLTIFITWCQQCM